MKYTTNVRFTFFIRVLICLSMLLVWGCAQKPGRKPQGPEGVKPPEQPIEKTQEKRLITVLIQEAEKFSADGNYQDALLIYNQALDEAVRMGQPGDTDRQNIMTRIEGVLSLTPPADIERFSAIKNLSVPPALFLFWIGHNYADLEDYPSAQVALETFLESYPGHSRADDARSLLSVIRQIRFDKDTLGCILPLSGKYKIYGEKALMGIQLAVRDLSQAYGRELRVIVKDTRSDPEQAALCVEELARDNVFAIAGPLLVPEAAGKKSEELGIPMIALTQKSEFPSQGEYLFSNFITPEMQVQALGAYIFMELGLKKVAILYPDERYGRRYMELFWDMVDQFHGQVVGVEAYDGNKTDFTQPLQKLTGEYYPVPGFLKPPAPPTDPDASAQKNSSRSSAVANEDRIKIDFQALFIPDAPSRVNLILPQLAFNDARGMVLLGNNLWHQKSLLTQAKGYNKNAVICDGYFGDSENPITAGFDKNFRALFGESPGFLEAVSYDTASLLFTGVMNSEVDSRQSLKDLLQGKLMFNGVTGSTVFDKTGTPHKELFLITVKNGRFMEINH